MMFFPEVVKLEDDVEEEKMPRIKASDNPLLDCEFDIKVDETNWMTPLIGTDSVFLNQDLDSYKKVTSSSNPNFESAKKFLDRFMEMEHNQEKSLILAYQRIIKVECKKTATQKRKFATFQDMHTKEYFIITRCQRFMATAVSYLVCQYYHDDEFKVDSCSAKNMFDVLRYQRKGNERGLSIPLTDNELSKLLQDTNGMEKSHFKI